MTQVSKIINQAKEYISHKLLPIIYRIGEPLEGNVFMLHLTDTFTDLFHDKCHNLITLGARESSHEVMEIGFNAGFSALLILLSNPNISLTCVDIGEHRYTLPCFYQLKKDFGDRIKLFVGSSITILPIMHHNYDLIHIDGGHFDACVVSDMNESLRLSKPGSILIMDDYNFGNIHTLWDNFCDHHLLIRVNGLDLVETEFHSIKQVPIGSIYSRI